MTKARGCIVTSWRIILPLRATVMAWSPQEDPIHRLFGHICGCVASGVSRPVISMMRRYADADAANDKFQRRSLLQCRTIGPAII
jgi:hypothetical protein